MFKSPMLRSVQRNCIFENIRQDAKIEVRVTVNRQLFLLSQLENRSHCVCFDSIVSC